MALTVLPESPKGGFGLALPHVLQNVPPLGRPGALMEHPRADRGNRRQSGTTVGDNQQQVLAPRSAPIQVPRIICSIFERLNLEWKNRTLKLFTQAP